MAHRDADKEEETISSTYCDNIAENGKTRSDPSSLNLPQFEKVSTTSTVSNQSTS